VKNEKIFVLREKSICNILQSAGVAIRENVQFSRLYFASIYPSKGTGIAVPLQAWSGPEGSRKLRFPDYMTTAQDGGEFVKLRIELRRKGRTKRSQST
jgi:hypothetical protein